MDIHNKYSDDEVLGSDRLLGKFINDERAKNIAILVNNFPISEDDAEDIYQESSIAFFNNIKEGKFKKGESRLSTYFTQICIYQSITRIRDGKKSVSLDNGRYDSSQIEALLGMGEHPMSVGQQLVMENLVKNMPPPCDKILWAYYYDNMSMAQIASLINFANAASVKAKKSQCMSKLKAIFKNISIEDFYEED